MSTFYVYIYIYIYVHCICVCIYIYVYIVHISVYIVYLFFGSPKKTSAKLQQGLAVQTFQQRALLLLRHHLPSSLRPGSAEGARLRGDESW